MSLVFVAPVQVSNCRGLDLFMVKCHELILSVCVIGTISFEGVGNQLLKNLVRLRLVKFIGSTLTVSSEQSHPFQAIGESNSVQVTLQQAGGPREPTFPKLVLEILRKDHKTSKGSLYWLQEGC